MANPNQARDNEGRWTSKSNMERGSIDVLDVAEAAGNAFLTFGPGVPPVARVTGAIGLYNFVRDNF